jgi:DNA-binding CsgD family transcriptional regulator
MLLDTAARTWTAGGEQEAQQTASYFRASVTPEVALRAFTAAREYDVTAALAGVQAPTVVLHRRDSTSQRLDVSRDLAAHIPGAQLQLLPGSAASPFSGDIEAGVAAIETFLGVSMARVEGSSALVTAGDSPLTTREAEVLRLVAQGRANKEIAAALGVSINTVERHLTNLYIKIECRSRSEATAYALRHGYA